MYSDCTPIVFWLYPDCARFLADCHRQPMQGPLLFFCVFIGSRARNSWTLQINMQLVWRRSKHIGPRCDECPRLRFDYRVYFILLTLSLASLRGKRLALKFRRCGYNDKYSSSQPFFYRARLPTSCPKLSPNCIKSGEYGGRVHERVSSSFLTLLPLPY